MSLSFLLPANIIIIALSLFSLVTNIPSDSWTGGHGKGFMGFAGHQNTLASAILFTMPGLISRGLKNKSQRSKVKNQNRSEKIRNLSLYFLLFLNLFILLLTYSRASVLSLICGAVVFLIITKRWNTLIYSSVVTILIFFMIWFSPSLKEKANELMKKDFPAFYSTREFLWIPSYHAALNGGLTGLGYGISDPQIEVPYSGSHYEEGRYVREKGNSVLALIEETGVIGFIIFLVPIVYIVKKQTANVKGDNKPQIRYPVSGIRNPVSAILLASLAAIIIHSQFEAWWAGVGSIQLPLFFFYIGVLLIAPAIKQLND